MVFIWGWDETSRVIDVGGMVGFLASLLIFGAAISLAVALPKNRRGSKAPVALVGVSGPTQIVSGGSG